MQNDREALMKQLRIDAQKLYNCRQLTKEQQAQYAVGIGKLEKRIEQLREATHFTFEAFHDLWVASIGTLTAGQAARVNMAALLQAMTAADKAYLFGDEARLLQEMQRIKEISDKARDDTPMQERMVI